MKTAVKSKSVLRQRELHGNIVAQPAPRPVLAARETEHDFPA